MKQRKRRSVILVCECHLSERVRRGPGEFTVAIIIQHSLQICASARNAIEISIAFPKREISIRPPGTSRIIIQVFLVFRDRQVIKFASEQAVGVLELTLISPLSIALRPLRRILLQGPNGLFDRIFRGDSTRRRRFVYRPGTTHFRLPLSRSDARQPKQHRQPQNCASPAFHFAVAKATLVIPASVQIFNTSTIFLYAPASSPRITTACSEFN